MRKTMAYIGLAVTLGLLLMLIPLATLGDISAEDHYLVPQMSWDRLRSLEGFDVDTSGSPLDELTVLGVNFVVALVAYAWFKHRTSDRDYVPGAFSF